jgi:dihydroorotate dehydrogenase (fumarate)
MTNIFKIGDIHFENQILNASGCWCLNENQLDELYSSSLSGIVCKTCTIFSKEGNTEPNYYYNIENKTHFNSKGLPNLGYQYYRNLSQKYNNKPYIISLAFEKYEDLQIILIDYNNFVDCSVLVELNLSCPNISSKIPGYDIFQIDKLLKILKHINLPNINYGFKLPPYFQLDSINEICKLFNNYTDILKYIVLSNSIPNCLPLNNGVPILSNLYGGMSGKINKHIALSNVVSFSNIIDKKIKIVGCGGIDTLIDVKDYLNNGADFVQLASCFYDVENNKLDTLKINELIRQFSEK